MVALTECTQRVNQLIKIDEVKQNIFMYEVRDKRDNSRVCMKIFNQLSADEDTSKKFLREVETHVSTSHPCVVELNGFVLPSRHQPAMIVMENCARGSLEENLRYRVFSSTRKAIIVTEIVSGMSHIHRCGIIHPNIMMSDRDDVKMCDFGESTFEPLGLTQTGGVGTLQFMSPEMLDGCDYDQSTDVFSSHCLRQDSKCPDERLPQWLSPKHPV